MVDAYLNIAERVLLDHRSPLKAKEILNYAYAHELLPDHLFGERQDRTLQARLSEDIARNLEESRFFRTGPGIFFLRELAHDPTIPEVYKGEYFAPSRRKELDRDHVLAFTGNIHELIRADGIGVSLTRLHELLRSGHYGYFPIAEIIHEPNLVALHSFVIVYHDQSVLSFRTGKYFANTDPLFGTRSIGLGGAVYPAHLDMLYESLFGVIASGISELSSGIGLPRRLAEQARYRNQVKPWIGAFQRRAKKHPNVLHIVMGFRCPVDFTPTKAALSVNDLRWVDAHNPANSLLDYDETSRFLFEGDYLREFIRGGDLP